MRIVKKEFTVYSFNELNQEAKNRVINWISQDDFYNQCTGEMATDVANEMVVDFCKELHDQLLESPYFEDDCITKDGLTMFGRSYWEKPEIEWDTCSAGFVRHIEISLPLVTGGTEEIQEMFEDANQGDDTCERLYDEVRKKIDQILHDQGSMWALKDYVISNEFEFTKNGKFYRD